MQSPIDKLLATKALGSITNKFGTNILQRASAFGVEATPRIPTGIYRLDYALGGGLPVGRVSVLWGDKSVTKTTTYIKAMAQAQAMCAVCWRYRPCACGSAAREPTIAFLDVEGTFDLAWAKKLGVDPDRFLLSKPENAEMTLDIGEGLLRNGCDILVLDSLAFLTPMKEIEESVSKETVGLQPRTIGKGIRKFVSAMNTQHNAHGQPPSIWCTNQKRMKVGVMFGSPETQPGGLAPGFASAVEVKMWGGKYTMDEVLGTPLSADFSFRVDKNKTSAAKMEGEFTLLMADTAHQRVGDADNATPMVADAEKLGFVSGGGSKWSAMGRDFKSKAALKDALVTDPDFYRQLHAALMSTLT